MDEVYQRHEVHEFMLQATRKMASDYDMIRRRTLEDPGTAGDQGEENWAELLREWLPPTYQVVTKGRILSHSGSAGPQIDVLILSPSYPRRLLGQKHYLAAGVVAAFECKTTVRTEHLVKTVENAGKIRGLLPRREGSPYRELHSPLIYGLLAHSHAWKQTDSDLHNFIMKHLQDASDRFLQHPSEMLDLMCIADLGLWHTSKAPFDEGYATISYLGHMLPWIQEPSPIGLALTILWNRMAWEDASLRPLAAYFTQLGLKGSYGGSGQVVPTDQLYSSGIRNVIEQQGSKAFYTDGRVEKWNEWKQPSFEHLY